MRVLNLLDGIKHKLTDELLMQLASAADLPADATRVTAAAAVPVLARQLAQPIDFDELNARWAMCRQLYLSQLLTQPEELLRTDQGWPSHRQLLAQKILGINQVAALAELSSQPEQACVVLGYLTIIALAVVGEHVTQAGLTPAEMGDWLARQDAPQVLPLAVGPPHSQAARPVAATSGSAKLVGAALLGSVAVAGAVGGYLGLGGMNENIKPAAPKVVSVVPVAPVPIAAPIAKAVDSIPAAPVVAMVPKATPPPAATHAKAAAPAVVVATGLRDTVGNEALARQIGGKFNPSVGRYPQGEDQPLIIKLANRATLTVGINSTESLLYKRLAHPSLPRPTDIAVDRLSFDLGQARLGAEGAQQLGSIASLLKTFPKVRLIVVGHANTHEAQAMFLGLQRANLAVDELVKQGIVASRLQAQGMLSSELPGDSDSAEKQAVLQGITLKISRL